MACWEWSIGGTACCEWSCGSAACCAGAGDTRTLNVNANAPSPRRQDEHTDEHTKSRIRSSESQTSLFPVRVADERSQTASMMRPGQTMRLGIPGSTATVLPDQALWSPENTWAAMVKIIAVSAAGSTAFATVHIAQHFMQPWSSAAGGT